jgi:hypothetical protein
MPPTDSIPEAFQFADASLSGGKTPPEPGECGTAPFTLLVNLTPISTDLTSGSTILTAVVAGLRRESARASDAPKAIHETLKANTDPRTLRVKTSRPQLRISHQGTVEGTAPAGAVVSTLIGFPSQRKIRRASKMPMSTVESAAPSRAA